MNGLPLASHLASAQKNERVPTAQNRDTLSSLLFFAYLFRLIFFLEFLNIFESPCHHYMVLRGEHIAGEGEGGVVPAFFDCEDVEVVFFADVGGYYVLTHPFFGDGELEDAVIAVQLNKVEDIFGVIADGGF